MLAKEKQGINLVNHLVLMSPIEALSKIQPFKFMM